MKKRLKKMIKLDKEGNEGRIRGDGFTPESLKDEIKKELEKRKDNLERNINAVGWLIVFLIIIPRALISFGIAGDTAVGVSYMSGMIIYFIISKITGRSY